MNNYEIRVIPKVSADGKTYWTASYPSIPDCVGGGYTADEAVKAAEENLAFYLECLEEEGEEIPSAYFPMQSSGKIALRIAKSTHERLARVAKDEGISTNMLISNAIEHFLGIKRYEFELDSKIQIIQTQAEQSLMLQMANYKINKDIWGAIEHNTIYVGVDD